MMCWYLFWFVKIKKKMIRVFVRVEYTQKPWNVSCTVKKQFQSCSDFCIWNAAFFSQWWPWNFFGFGIAYSGLGHFGLGFIFWCIEKIFLVRWNDPLPEIQFIGNAWGKKKIKANIKIKYKESKRKINCKM